MATKDIPKPPYQTTWKKGGSWKYELFAPKKYIAWNRIPKALSEQRRTNGFVLDGLGLSRFSELFTCPKTYRPRLPSFLEAREFPYDEPLEIKLT